MRSQADIITIQALLKHEEALTTELEQARQEIDATVSGRMRRAALTVERDRLRDEVTRVSEERDSAIRQLEQSRAFGARMLDERDQARAELAQVKADLSAIHFAYTTLVEGIKAIVWDLEANDYTNYFFYDALCNLIQGIKE